MPKYQLIFDSNKVIPDDEFEELGKKFMEQYPEFTFKYGMNLEGIRKEFWEKKEQLIENIPYLQYDNNQRKLLNDKFEDLSNLFNLNE